MAIFAVCGTENSATPSAPNAVKNCACLFLSVSDENVCCDKRFSAKSSASDGASSAYEISIRARESSNTTTRSPITAQTAARLLLFLISPKKKPRQKCIGLLSSGFLAEIKNAPILAQEFLTEARTLRVGNFFFAFSFRFFLLRLTS